MLEDIESADGAVGGITLNDWEQEFIDSIRGRLESGRDLTEAQGEKLEQIWNRI
jgi:hypothetical protein